MGSVTSELRYNPFTGQPVVPGVIDSMPAAARLGLEPARFCRDCGRRMVVQIVPDGWSSTCSRHGVVDSTSLERR
ncbi:hypothetical protein HQ346_08365 [Rhodococcus sp. BP-252]|uniref:Biotin synthase auxiliary protein n=1 Tax=Rhodococcoides kyotonense TaxID=398843 RepID=A0A177YPC1_9NOCA|nr:hypothetical protein [Rhodococcus sp. BP-320]MBY6415972.1 hypothetical protein [Rhodococcus sp. BP-321]MBY6420519.1 hypothetical protein [Rhodococcus sp. BP-324]MBY6426179.1 hypothetical protein [Rhodococcus sp. BP-323]MBY6431280.1 hypothetical protein [Rhodococcus sp. BP-322]MBY6440392.1 hypothetical protein [Rhodococcus sp. BP-319]MBY6445015.1 hypothetical protein [Rhodococcus sp. BP-318]MBY6450065.1 hypothetical protein [Rhodococcus sp. BP-315]MBY6455152.1 hypothetical protein [Rhodoc